MDAPLNLVEILRASDEATRREFLKRVLAAGASGPLLAAYLAACGGAAPTPTTAPVAAQTTPTQPAVVPTISGQQPAAPSPTRAAGAGASPGAASPVAAATTAAPTQPAAAAKRGGTLVLTGHQEIASLSPDDWGPTVHYVIVANIHGTLLRLDENYALQPDLAESFMVAPDGLKYTFTLNKGVKWHDGTPFTSADVKYTYEFYADPANAAINQPLLKDIASVETPDDNTVVITLKTTNAGFLANGATIGIVPKHHHSKIGEKEYKKNPIGTGPFKLKEWKPQEYTIVEAYDGYFRGRPNLDAIRENIVPEAAVRAIGLDTGETDSAVWPIAPEDSLRMMGDQKFVVFRAPGTAVNHFPLNNQRPVLQDKRVRQAMLYAINRDNLVKDLLKGLAVKATSNLSPAVVAFYNPDVTQYDFNVDKAKQLLDEAGFAPGPDGIRANSAGTKLSFTTMVITGDALRRSEAELVQRDLKQVGIEMKLQDFAVAEVLSKCRAGDFDAALFNWTYGTAEPDPSDSLKTGALSNFSHYSSPRVDDLIEQGLKETDPAKRKTIYGEIQKVVADDVPFLFIMYWETVLIFNKRVKGLPAKATNPYSFYTWGSHKLSKE